MYILMNDENYNTDYNERKIINISEMCFKEKGNQKNDKLK